MVHRSINHFYSGPPLSRHSASIKQLLALSLAKNSILLTISATGLNKESDKPEPPLELEVVPPTSSIQERGDFEWTIDIWLNLGALYLTYFSCVSAQAVPGSSLGFIQKSFPLESAASPWIAGVGSLCLCVISSFIGELSDIFGRRYFLFFAACCGVAGMFDPLPGRVGRGHYRRPDNHKCGLLGRISHYSAGC